jgi:outer membrane protein insertion porin family
MFAKQTMLSASLVALVGVSAPVRADSEPMTGAAGEVRPEAELDPEPGDVAPLTRHPKRLLPGARKEPTGRFSIGAGVSTDESFIATATVAQDDLFGTGNHLMMHTRLSARRQLFLARLADPDLFGTRLAWSADLYNDLRQRPGFVRKAVGGALTLSHPVDEHVRVFAGYRVEKVGADSSEPNAPRALDALAPALRGGIVSSLRAGLVYSTLDRADAPSTGSSVGGWIEIADRALASDLTFTRVHGWAQHHRSIGPAILHLGGRFTGIESHDPSGLPRNERLFLDSSAEIRGYRPDSFGPTDPLGTPLGGDIKLTGAIELEVPIARRIGLSAVAFANAGALLDRSGEGAVGRSVGLGLLWRTPIGPLRIDWAVPLDGSKPGFVFGLGSAF